MKTILMSLKASSQWLELLTQTGSIFFGEYFYSLLGERKLFQSISHYQCELCHEACGGE
jgi:hypothetical protein